MQSRVFIATATARAFCLGFLCALLSACGPDETSSKSTASEPAVSTNPTANLEIRTAIVRELGNDIELVSAVGKRPGTHNPLEAVVAVHNRGNSEQRLQVSGKWQDNSGRGFGGSSSVLAVGPGQVAKFEAGTRSTDATRLVVTIQPESGTEAQRLNSTLVKASQGVQGYGIAYTPTPTLAEIPAWPPRGVANGGAFEGKTLLFTPFESEWKLQIIDAAMDPMKGIAYARSSDSDLQVMHINLPGEPYSGAEFIRELAYGGGYFQIKPSLDAQNTTSWNSEIAWAIEITEWNQQPWREGGGTFQQGGTASGRLYICFKGTAGMIESSFVAGEFADAPIIYYGPPG